jgi:hypothetical protein
MPRFLQLSKVLVNVDAIKFILPGLVKAKEGESFGCSVYFVSTPEPHAFYGEDAKRLIAFAKENQISILPSDSVTVPSF